MKNINNILLTEKYRPQNLEDLITPKRVRSKLEKGVYHGVQYINKYNRPENRVSPQSILYFYMTR